jgi:hypothetical protein
MYRTPYSRHNTDKKMKKMYKDRVSKTTPVMETTIEGAQKRIVEAIEWMEWFIEEMEKKMEDEGYDTSALSSLHTTATNLEYIGVFLDTVDDEMAAITSSCNSLHDRYVAAVAEIDQLRRENESLRKANLNNLHAADDNR